MKSKFITLFEKVMRDENKKIISESHESVEINKRMKNKDTQSLEEAYKKVRLLQEEDSEMEDGEVGSEIAVEIYLRRESDNMDPEKKQAFEAIKSKLEQKGYVVEPFKHTLKNGSAVLELTVHTSSGWDESVDRHTLEIKKMLSEYQFKAVYMAGYPE